MAILEILGSIVCKIFKIVLNVIIIIMYRAGRQGEFLGVGGTWNLNEEKTVDSEIIASGIFVGYLIYTIVSMITLCLGSEDHKINFTDILMNIVGVFLWFAIGATAIHYWTLGYNQEVRYTEPGPEQQVGLALGSLAIINAVVYIADSGLSILYFIRNKL